ncbi:MAG: SUMF1/EgtB/PvdO family nonheme iron enzyme, partial [Deltaproteobacteria bacterium]
MIDKNNKKKSCGYLLIISSLFLFSCSIEKAPRIEGMVYIPSGEFIMGSEDVDTEGLAKEFGDRKGRYYEDEKPMRKIFLKGFYIGKYEVTNMEYKAFVTAAGYPPPPTWVNNSEVNHPVTNVTWFDAYNYCAWAG